MRACSGSSQPPALGVPIPRNSASRSFVPAPATSQGRLSWPLFMPHKIFLWDPNGVYVDCCFPNPRYGHFLNHKTLKGARVLDLFSRSVGHRLKTTIQAAWKTKEDQRTRLVFERDAQHYEAAVICVPTQEGQVIGFVTDRLVGPQGLVIDLPPSAASHDLSLAIPSLQAWPKESLSTLTPQELKVLAVMGFQTSKGSRHMSWENVDVMEGHLRPDLTNHDIAQHLQLSVRTVKFHLTNIYRKLQITSRYQLSPPS